MFEVIGKRAATPEFRGCVFINAAADLPDRRHPARAVASHHKHALLELIVQRTAQLGVANPQGLARQLKLLLEGAVATALVDPGLQPARDAAATLLAAEGIGKRAVLMPDEARQPSPATAAPATPAAVLAAWLADLVAIVHQHIANLTAEELAFQPDPQGNSIGVTVWHFSRWLDVVGRAFASQPPSGELWHTAGWAARTGYDPTGIGVQGLGVLTGYTRAEVVQVPALSAAELLNYLNQVTDRLLQALDGMPTQVLHAPAPGLGTRSRYSLLSTVLQGSFGHVGEIEALKAMRTRRLATGS